jgi:hypothetical protein
MDYLWTSTIAGDGSGDPIGVRVNGGTPCPNSIYAGTMTCPLAPSYTYFATCVK